MSYAKVTLLIRNGCKNEVQILHSTTCCIGILWMLNHSPWSPLHILCLLGNVLSVLFPPFPPPFFQQHGLTSTKIALLMIPLRSTAMQMFKGMTQYSYGTIILYLNPTCCYKQCCSIRVGERHPRSPGVRYSRARCKVSPLFPLVFLYYYYY